MVYCFVYSNYSTGLPYRMGKHQGKERTKSLLWEHDWFPGMKKTVKAELDQCLACQTTAQPNSLEQILSSLLPSGVWDKLKIDVYGPLPSGQYILVILLFLIP